MPALCSWAYYGLLSWEQLIAESVVQLQPDLHAASCRWKRNLVVRMTAVAMVFPVSLCNNLQKTFAQQTRIFAFAERLPLTRC